MIDKDSGHNLAALCAIEAPIEAVTCEPFPQTGQSQVVPVWALQRRNDIERKEVQEAPCEFYSSPMIWIRIPAEES